MSLKTIQYKLYLLSLKWMVFFAILHSVTEISMMLMYAKHDPKFFFIIFPVTALIVAVYLFISILLKREISISKSTYVFNWWIGFSLCFGFFVVDDNLIGTPTNLIMLAVLIWYGLFFPKSWGIALVLGLLVYNGTRSLLLNFTDFNPLILDYHPIFELYFLLATFCLIVILSSLKKHKSNRLYSILLTRQQILEVDIQHTIRLYNATYFDYRAFKTNFDEHTREVLGICKQVYQLLLTPLSAKPKQIFNKTERLLNTIDSILRAIQSSVISWNDMEVAPKLNKNKFKHINFTDYALDRKIFLYFSIILAIGITFFINEKNLHSYAIITLFLTFLFALTYLFYPINPKFTSVFGFFNTTLILIYLHFSFSSLSGTAPILLMMELLFCIFLIYRFGWEKVFLIPIVFIVFSCIHFYLIRSGTIQSIILHDPPLPNLVLFYFIIGLSLLVLSSFFKDRSTDFIQKLEDLNKERRAKRDELLRIKHKRSKQINHLYELSDTNSHKLRAPVARILSLVALFNEVPSLEVLKEEFGLNMVESINQSVAEIENEILDMQLHFEQYQLFNDTIY